MTTHHTAITELLDELAAAYTARDHERAIELFADDIAFVGTGADELQFGGAELAMQVERDLGQADALEARFSEVRVSATDADHVAWFYAHLDLDVTAGGESFVMPMRVTGVASRAARWQFRQTHFSLPSADQPEGDSFPTSTETSAAEQVVSVWRSAIESGDHSMFVGLYTDEALFDVSLPDGRFQLVGANRIRHQFDQWHSSAPKLVEWDQRPTASGAVVELALWEGDQHDLYSRSMHLFDIEAAQITRHVMYCIGDWTRETFDAVQLDLVHP